MAADNWIPLAQSNLKPEKSDVNSGQDRITFQKAIRKAIKAKD
jgi:hypothetical protein